MYNFAYGAFYASRVVEEARRHVDDSLRRLISPYKRKNLQSEAWMNIAMVDETFVRRNIRNTTI